MTLTAPPRPPLPGDPVERDELEALIEEARQRARRRRLVYAAGAVLAALVGVVAFMVLERSAQSQSSPAALAAGSALAGGSAGSKIAFISAPHLHGGLGGVLHVMNADGSGQRVVTRNAWRGGAWSPDGQRIVLLRDSGIYVVNADGTGERRLTRSAQDFDPVWSPDGRNIAFTRGRYKEGRNRGSWDFIEVYVMNADGTGQRRLTNTRHDMSPAWLPDGRIAFVRVVGGRSPLTFELYVMNADGRGQRNLTRERLRDAQLRSNFFWSPDGRKIAFTSERDGNVGLYVMNADGSGQRRLIRSVGLYINAGTSGQRRLTRPAGLSWIAWSPDARRIAFVRERERQLRRRYHSEIYVIDADGGRERRLTQRGANPRWSPDGEKIAFRSSRDGNIELYVMNADGSGQRRLTQATQDGATVQFDFAWSPAQKN